MENSRINLDISALIQITKLLHKTKYNRQMFDTLKTCKENVNIKIIFPLSMGYQSRKDETFIIE